jgi:hypothetical protein
MSNNKFNNKFLDFLTDKKSFNEFIKKYPNFIPSYYFNDTSTTSGGTNINNTITNYFKIKFYLKAYLQNITNILNIIKLNEFDLKSIEINDIKMKRYNFSENIFNFHLEDTGNTFFKNDRLFMDKILKQELIIKGYTLKKGFLKSKITNVIKKTGLTTNNNRNEINFNNFLLNKNVFNNIKFPLYIILLKDNYNKNENNKKYYLQLFKTHLNYINKLFNNKNIIGISSFSPLFEILENSSKNNNLNNENKKSNMNKENNKEKIYIIGNSTVINPPNNKTNNTNNTNNTNKFYENIPENSNLYQTYDINNILDNKVKKNNEYFKIFYEAMKNISNQKYDNLYDYIINALLLEQNFILFITSWIETESFKKIFRLDNLIKGDINKNIQLFMQYYNTFKLNESNISSLSNGSNVFNPIDFNTFFDSKFTKP